jgi:hypothetical protein
VVQFIFVGDRTDISLRVAVCLHVACGDRGWQASERTPSGAVAIVFRSPLSLGTTLD